MWEWDWNAVMYSRADLTKLHKNFFLPSAQKLYNLIRRSRPQDTTPDTLKLLEDISRRCNTCQTFGARLLRFRVSMPEEHLVFNEELSLELMWLNGKAVLHIVDTATGFNAAEPLRANPSKTSGTHSLLVGLQFIPAAPTKSASTKAASSHLSDGSD